MISDVDKVFFEEEVTKLVALSCLVENAVGVKVGIDLASPVGNALDRLCWASAMLTFKRGSSKVLMQILTWP